MNMSSPSALNELELDALTELVNLGVSKAALSLREMIGEQVLLSVPSVGLDRAHAGDRDLGKNEPNKLVAVHQVFEGDIHGRALLIFPETRSLELVRAVTSGNLPLEDILELEQEALAETGNIILNGCLATIANLLQRTLKISLPEILRGDSASLFNLPPPPEAGDFVLFVYINFSVRERDIQGYIALLMDLPSLEALKILLDEFIQRTAGEARRYPRMLDTDPKRSGVGPVRCRGLGRRASRLRSPRGRVELMAGVRDRPFRPRPRSAGGSKICFRNGSVSTLLSPYGFAGIGHVASTEPVPAPDALAAENALGSGHDPRSDGACGRYPPNRYCLIQVFDVSVAVKRYMPCCVAEDRAAAISAAKRAVGEMLPTYWRLGQRLEGAKQALTMESGISEAEFAAAADRLRAGEDAAEVLDARFVEAFAVAGTAAECAARVAACAEAGVTELALTFSGGQSGTEMNELAAACQSLAA